MTGPGRRAQTGFLAFLIPFALFLCLMVLSIGVWRHVKESVQPPMYDPINYMQKAKAFWDMVASGHWQNPLDLQPVFRPPGTIFLSYPFGFTEDFKGYLARSVIVPILAIATALYVVRFRGKMSTAEHLDLAAVALILTTMPCFYHFEAIDGTNSPVHWGLVDNFLAGIAALAFAIGYRGAERRSWLLLMLASLTTGFCLMIKPAGTIVAAIIIVVLLVSMITRELSASSDTLSLSGAFRLIFSFRAVCLLATLSLGTALFLVASLNSGYMSRDTIQYGNTAMKILRDNFASALSVKRLTSVLFPSFGLNLIFFGLITAIGAITVARVGIRARASGLRARASGLALLAKFLDPILATAVVALGVFFWLVYADLSQVRYFFPFAFISFILTAIFLLDAIRGRNAPFARALLYGSSGMLFGALTLMLYLPHLDQTWQQRFGVNLSSSNGKKTRTLTDLLLHESKRQGRDLGLYDLACSWDVSPITCWGLTKKVLHPAEPAFGTYTPSDWVYAPVVHLDDVFRSDFILYHPPDSAVQKAAAPGVKRTGVYGEVDTISAWLTEANQESGLKNVVSGKLAMKQVVDAKLFARSFAGWAASQSWPDTFMTENADFLLNTGAATPPSQVINRDSGEATEIFEQAIAIDGVQVETASPLMLRIDWRPITENLPDDLFFFVHVIDQQGGVLSARQFNLNSRLWVNPTAGLLHHTLVRCNIHLTSGVLRYGFGIFQGIHTQRLLNPSPAGNDFAGKRVDRVTKVP